MKVSIEQHGMLHLQNGIDTGLLLSTWHRSLVDLRCIGIDAEKLHTMYVSRSHSKVTKVSMFYKGVIKLSKMHGTRFLNIYNPS